MMIPEMPTGDGNSRRHKVLVAMSGGVDSSVAAAILKAAGHEVVGCFMRLGDPDEPDLQTDSTSVGSKSGCHRQGCCSVHDAADAREVASLLGIPFYVLNFRRQFDQIIDYFVGEYNAGRTPNPCVRCNDWLKFGRLHDYAQSIDCQFVASGHYARIDRRYGSARLLRGRDSHKDQSYVLFGTRRQRLEHLLLPVGELEKDAVRQIAKAHRLPVFDKPDSQEICFVPDNDYAGLVQRRTPDRISDGDIVDNTGEVVGRHSGHQHYTIGQRRGVGVALGYPVYVTQIDPQANRVTIGTKESLRSGGCFADQVNWLIDSAPFQWRRCQAKVRYNGGSSPARVRAISEDALEVRFDRPIDAVTPGQAVVCYDGSRVLGGGWITEALG